MSRNIQTHEYFMSKISENYEPINIYTGSQEKITCICKICGSEKTAKAAEFMRKRIICRTCNPIMKYTPESFKEVLKEKNPTIIPLEDYNGTNTKIKFQCAICGYTFNTTPYNVERGSLCRKCYGTALKTNEEFLQELKEKNPNLIALSEYRGANSRMLFHCNICNYEWESSSASVLRTKGSGCPNCYGNVKKKYEEVVKLAYDKNNNIEILGVEDNKEFKNVKTKLKVKCKIDGYEWVASAGSLIATHNSGCPKCAGNLQKTTESFKEECYMRNKNIKMIGKYTGIYNKVKFKCSICETEFERVAHHVISHGLFCPHCNLSAGELKIKEFLNKNNVAYIPQYKFQDCKDIKSLPFDFYLPDYNTLIEYDGRQHFKVSYFGNETEEQAKENLLVTQKHDQIKTKYCEDNNIKLLRIPYWNYNNVENILEEELEI